MKREVENWTILKLHKLRNQIVFPEFQREKTLWSREMKILLIDTIFSDIDIPKFYFNLNDKNEYEVVDGQQRLWAIWEYLDDEYACAVNRKMLKFSQLTVSNKDLVQKYKVQITVFEDAEDEYLREHFVRLQLGLPLITGERLNAATGEMKEFVFKTLAKHVFIAKLGMPKRRYAKETLCAQIAINSFGRKKTGTFQRTRWEDLRDFFQVYEHPQATTDVEIFSERKQTITNVLGQLWDCFASRASQLKNRSYILSIYLFFEELVMQKKLGVTEQKRFVTFVFKLWQRLREEVKAGIDRKNKHLYAFQTSLSSAPGEKYQIERRHTKLTEFYTHFRATGRILGDDEA